MAMRSVDESRISHEERLRKQAIEEKRRDAKVVYNTDRADVAQLVEQLIRNQ